MNWDELVAKLKQERDELALKVHLGSKDAAAEWEKLETKWREVAATKMPPMKEAARETTAGVAEELKKGYERFRKLL
jgi:hypothetical protein